MKKDIEIKICRDNFIYVDISDSMEKLVGKFNHEEKQVFFR